MNSKEYVGKVRFCLITDEVKRMGRGHYDIAKAGLQAGADMIQLRDKSMPDKEMELIAEKILPICQEKEALFIINDRVEVARKVGADGVHLGQEDRQVQEARAMLGSEAIIGKSATNFQEAIKADKEDIDYLGIGPVFATPSKDDANLPMGLEELEKICRSVKKPVLAIGGINIDNLDFVISAGVDGIAVISAVCQANNMVSEARRLIIGLMT